MKIDNQQLCNLTNNQLQVILSGILGDGFLTKFKFKNSYFTTCCKYEEYIDFKKNLLSELFINKTYKKENGFCKTPIYVLRSKSDNRLTNLSTLSLKEILNSLDDLGLAMWIYDDGSLHKNKLFYNINTHSFSKEDQEKYLIPFLNKYNIYPKLTKEVKKDGRMFYYLRISKYEGAYEINKILEKYKIDCYNYKLWSSETIRNWSKLQVQLKRQGISVSKRRFGILLNILNNTNDIQDIVQSLEKSKAGVIPLNK
mgnify:CR=1 FL=1